jgi:hypothetical protein
MFRDGREDRHWPIPPWRRAGCVATSNALTCPAYGGPLSSRGYRSTETGTYVRYPLDEQPKISEADDELSWLEDVLCDWERRYSLSYFVDATPTGPVLVPRTSRVKTCRR